MKKIEAKTLEEAYAKAAETFDCSVTDLEYEIVQHPSNGFLGFGTKKAIIVAACRTLPSPSKSPDSKRETSPASLERTVTSKHKAPEEPAVTEDVSTHTSPATPQKTASSPSHASETAILDGFFDDTVKKPAPSLPETNETQVTYSEKELGPLIENRLGTLMRSACFDIDTVEVDVIGGTAYIFIDGEDAALLIGKEGYRYNAISYLLYNWIHNKYGLFIKLEIAQFLASQQEMIRNYIQPVIEHIHQEGWGKTRPLDGILVQIALEQLREEFPNKYVAIKRTRNGERYILVNEFNKRP